MKPNIKIRRLVLDIKQEGARKEWAVSLQNETCCMGVWTFDATEQGKAKAHYYGKMLAECVGAEIGDGSELLMAPGLLAILGIDAPPEGKL